MPATERSATRYRFTPAVDLATAFATLDIESLPVSASRAITIYRRAVLNVEVTDGELAAARTVVVDVVNQAPGGEHTPPLSDALLERVGDVTAADARPLS